ncbi:hypothetical protein [Actinomadura sp. RB99]|uniref:hypothetical protein n=1 Tax=Actinomadura sp. RB99 TaxID=2691577 RepID=UPI001685141A|nr:hypothetical protein [Actinomadura sp. RB99]
MAPVVGAACPVAMTGDVFPTGAGIPEPRGWTSATTTQTGRSRSYWLWNWTMSRCVPAAGKSLAMTPLSLARGFVAIIDGLLASAGA